MKARIGVLGAGGGLDLRMSSEESQPLANAFPLDSERGSCIRIEFNPTESSSTKLPLYIYYFVIDDAAEISAMRF